MTLKWPWWGTLAGPSDYQAREILRAILDLHGYYGSGETWLWRGQVSKDFSLSPAIHSRLKGSTYDISDTNVVTASEQLLAKTRSARLDIHEDVALPDLALLARLQHHGAATPLLDVSYDPLVALYMAVVSATPKHQEHDGVLFAIKEPGEKHRLQNFDSRSFGDIYDRLPKDQYSLYTAPDVSDRLRIQRGHFLLSRCSEGDERTTIKTSLDAAARQEDTWLNKRLQKRGVQGKIPQATSDLAVFRIPAKLKHGLAEWLQGRTGLTKDFVYPTVWHQPHYDTFASSHGRRSPMIL